MKPVSVAAVQIRKWTEASGRDADDWLAVEEPLELRLVSGPEGLSKSISVTMRTPGHDPELAIGFLFTEGMIADAAAVDSVQQLLFDDNIVEVKLREGIQPRLDQLERHFYTTSSCGVCGKSSIDAVRTVSPYAGVGSSLSVLPELLEQLPERLRKRQDVFEQTGGLHATALFNAGGELLLLREDVGRHNALDKLIGAALQAGMLPLNDHILLLSGRASFELIQKAAMAGVRIVAAVGAPSSLAVSLAKDNHMTLAGFVRKGRFNIYCGAERIQTP